MASASALVTHCVIRNNRDTYYTGGGGVYMSGGEVRNCLITYNRVTLDGAAQGGGGVRQTGGTLASCTVVSNQIQAANKGGGVWWVAGNVTNTIIYWNVRGVVADNLLASAPTTIGYSCAPELTNGIGNVVLDPDFIDMPGGNYHLAPGSSCMDTGTNMSWMAGAVDLDGNKRVITARPDMGAYEFWPSTVLVVR